VNPPNRKVRVTRERRRYVDSAEQVAALLDAAAELDRDARADRGQHRRAIVALLAFAGLRIDEARRLRWRDVDLATERLFVTVPGQLILCTSLIFNLVAYLWARKILNADI